MHLQYPLLGFIVSEGTVGMDPEKERPIREWPTTTSRKQLQWFLGFANFYKKFIKNFSSVASPLQALTSLNSRFVWSSLAEEAFQRLKRSLTLAPVLMLSDPKL